MGDDNTLKLLVMAKGNPCHEPGGQPTGGQFCSTESSGDGAKPKKVGGKAPNKGRKVVLDPAIRRVLQPTIMERIEDTEKIVDHNDAIAALNPIIADIENIKGLKTRLVADAAWRAERIARGPGYNRADMKSYEKAVSGHDYHPHENTKKILDRAMYWVKSVNYKVSNRWVFYNLLQDGTYSRKADAEDLTDKMSDARKAFYGEWRPDTLADETRKPIYADGGHRDEKSWLNTMDENKIYLTERDERPTYPEIWFEAKAMTPQFQHYAPKIALRPFGGDMSVPGKWEIVDRFRLIHDIYPDKPIQVLYFGDNDKKGNEIDKTVRDEVGGWCKGYGIKFEFTRVGLKNGDEDTYHITENPEKPGDYQWEALSDEGARALIKSGLDLIPDLEESDRRTKERQDAIQAKYDRHWPEFRKKIEGSKVLTETEELTQLAADALDAKDRYRRRLMRGS